MVPCLLFIAVGMIQGDGRGEVLPRNDPPSPVHGRSFILSTRRISHEVLESMMNEKLISLGI